MIKNKTENKSDIYIDSIDAKFRNEVELTIREAAKIFTNDIVTGKKSLEEMHKDIINSSIPPNIKACIAMLIGMEMPNKLGVKILKN